MKGFRLALIAAAAVILVVSCKTTEANYRAAYEKTMAARAEQDSIEDTIYGQRRQMQQRTVDTPDGRVEVKAQFVRVTEDGGGIPENLRQYSVVVGQFKQLFNAKSMRNRLADSGYPGAFVVETGEPYYYIVLASFSDAAQAAEALEKFKAKPAISMKEPCPFILDAGGRRRPTTHKTK